MDLKDNCVISKCFSELFYFDNCCNIDNMKVLLLAFLCQIFVAVHGLKCYTCTLTVPEGQENNIDMSCLNDPAKAPGRPVLTCQASKKYCTIFRVDSKVTGAMTSLERTCSVKPVIDNDDVESDAEITHFRNCMTDLCNDGKGDEDPSWDHDDDTGSLGGTIVPGRSNAHLAKFDMLIFTSVVTISLLKLVC